MAPGRQEMSSLRQREPVVRSFSIGTAAPAIVPPQPPGWDQLLYAASGVVTVVTPAGRWVVPPTRAVWVPDGVVHRIEVTGWARLRNLYLATGVAPGRPAPRVLQVPPLLRELLLAVVARAPVWPDDGPDRRLVAVLVDELADLPDAPLHLPLPVDGRARSVAEVLLADPGTARSIEHLAAEAGASRRTIERAFLAGTGLSLARWRTQARLLHALRLLAGGRTTEQTAAAVGYSTPSAFVAAFRRELGTTPRRWAER